MLVKEVLLSVCIAVYNVENYIEKCLDSVLEQDFDDYEMVLVDNGSDDRSIEICESYREKYPEKIKFYKLPKPTVIGRAYYECFRKMNGLYYLSLDSDDYLCEGALKNIAEAIRRSRADLIMGTFVCDLEDDETNFKDADIVADKINTVSYEEALHYIVSLDNFHTVQWRFIQKIRKDHTLAKPGPDLSGAGSPGLCSRFDDTYNVMEIFRNATSIYYLDIPFYVYRRRRGSITGARINEDLIIDYLKVALASLALIECQTQNGEFAIREYVKKQQAVKFSLFKYCIHLLSPEGRKQICAVIWHNMEIFQLCPKYGSDDMKEMYRCMSKSNMRDGFRGYIEAVSGGVVRKAVEKKDDGVVIFPTGTISAGLERLLSEHGVDIDAYIDNDEKKDGQTFFGKTCFLPARYVKSREDSVLKLYIIATVYSNLREKLKSQLLGYGISEDAIFIWE